MLKEHKMGEEAHWRENCARAMVAVEVGEDDGDPTMRYRRGEIE